MALDGEPLLITPSTSEQLIEEGPIEAGPPVTGLPMTAESILLNNVPTTAFAVANI